MSLVFPLPSSALRPRVEANLLAASRVRAVDLASERHLMTTKWFNYRFMSPLDATHLFADTYVDCYRRKWRQTFSADEASSKRALADLTEPREFTSLWRARQKADLAGVPYELYIECAMDFFLRPGAKKVPRPNQLCSKKLGPAFIAHVRERWAEHIESVFVISSEPAYRNEAYCGFSAQREHREWVIERLKARGTPDYLLGKCCFLDRVLPEEQAIDLFGREKVDRAREAVVGEHSAPVAAATGGDHLPTCYVLPHAVLIEAEECHACPLAGNCQTVGGKVRQLLIKRYRSDDPIGARDRLLNQERVARSRAKAAAAAPRGGEACAA
jgi:hypothetical protein